MDPVPVSSPWFLSRMFQYLVPTVLGFFLFQINPCENGNLYFKLKLRKEK